MGHGTLPELLLYFRMPDPEMPSSIRQLGLQSLQLPKGLLEPKEGTGPDGSRSYKPAKVTIKRHKNSVILSMIQSVIQDL